MSKHSVSKANRICVASDEDLLSNAELQSIRQGMDDIRHGRTHRMNEGESLSEFIDRYIEDDDLTNPSILIIPDVHGRTFWRERPSKSTHSCQQSSLVTTLIHSLTRRFCPCRRLQSLSRF